MSTEAALIIGVVLGALIVLVADYRAQKRGQIEREALADAHNEIRHLYTRLTNHITAANVDHHLTQQKAITDSQIAYQLGINADEDQMPPETPAGVMSDRDLEDLI